MHMKVKVKIDITKNNDHQRSENLIENVFKKQAPIKVKKILKFQH